MAREPTAVAELRRVLGEQLATFRKAAELTQAELAAEVFCDRTTVAHIEKGRANADERFWQAADRITGADGVLVAAFSRLEAVKRENDLRVRQAELASARAKADGFRSSELTKWQSALASYDDELVSLELARRVAASDVGNDTLTQLEMNFDDLATAYPVTPPPELLPRLRQQLTYVTSIMDARKTLAEHRRLLTIGGWLSLLTATVHIDLNQQQAASARLRTAASLARHAELDEIRAWCFETEAWRMLTDGDYQRAVELSKAAQHLAPSGNFCRYSGDGTRRPSMGPTKTAERNLCRD